MTPTDLINLASLDQYLIGLDDDKKKYLRPILENQLKYLNDLAGRGDVYIMTPDRARLMMNIVSMAFRDLLVGDIVGIQPITNPVAAVDHFSYVLDEHGTVTSLQARNIDIEAGARKLQLSWSVENEQDAIADSTNDNFIATAAKQLINEITSEIINDLVLLAKKNEPSAFKIVPDNLINSLQILITQYRTNIAVITRRGVGNRIIVGAKAYALIQQMTQWQGVSDADEEFDNSQSLLFVGTVFDARTKVYTSACLKENEILIGYSSDVSLLLSQVDCGYIYSPYIPLMTGGVVVDPTSLRPELRFMTRYGKVVPQDQPMNNAQDYYRLIEI